MSLVAALAALPAQAADRTSSEALEFPAETAALIAVTTALFHEAERAAAGKQSTEQPVIGRPRILSPATLESPDLALNALTNHGAVRNLTGYRINWYPMSRLLGTVDFMGTWNSNRDLVCGYVSWDLSKSNDPVLESVQANYIDLNELDSASPEMVHKALLDANCAFGAVDANFAFFEPAH